MCECAKLVIDSVYGYTGSCLGCSWLAIKRSFISRHAAVEHIPVGRRPSLEEPQASRYKEYKQLVLDL